MQSPYLVITRAYPAIVVFGDVAVVATGADVGGSGDNIVVIFGNTVLRGNSNCLVSFVGDSTESIDPGVVFDLHSRQSINLCSR